MIDFHNFELSNQMFLSLSIVLYTLLHLNDTSFEIIVNIQKFLLDSDSVRRYYNSSIDDS